VLSKVATLTQQLDVADVIASASTQWDPMVTVELIAELNAAPWASASAALLVEKIADLLRRKRTASRQLFRPPPCYSSGGS
jgi:uncharacterized protein with von Willebrand factor type A (vWA) domain